MLGDGNPGFVEQSGGRVATSWNLYVSRAAGGAGSQYSISGGRLAANEIVVGDVGGVGTVVQTGGVVTTRGRVCLNLRKGSSYGIWNISGGGLAIGTDLDCDGAGGAGQLNISGGVVVVRGNITPLTNGSQITISGNGRLLVNPNHGEDEANIQERIDQGEIVGDNLVVDSVTFNGRRFTRVTVAQE